MHGFHGDRFETANEQRSSPCSIGLVVVQNGEIVKSLSCLICPPELRFNAINIAIHGIKPHDVAGEPEFPQIWEALRCYLEGNVLVAHNAAFDMSVLNRTLEHYGIPHAPFNCHCTCKISKRVWPRLYDRKLDSVARKLGIRFKHHDACEDARACAEIARQACLETESASLGELAEKIGLLKRNSRIRRDPQKIS
jgi:DNA polymerase III subunit epsilon